MLTAGTNSGNFMLSYLKMVYVHLDWTVHNDTDILKMLTASWNMFTIERICHFRVQQLEIFTNTQQCCGTVSIFIEWNILSSLNLSCWECWYRILFQEFNDTYWLHITGNVLCCITILVLKVWTTSLTWQAEEHALPTGDCGLQMKLL